MGTCNSTATTSFEASSRSRAIDREIAHEKRVLDSERVVRLLLLGAGETGKSTVLKQFRLIYGTGYTLQDRNTFKLAILSNIVACGKSLVYAMDTLRIPYGFEPFPGGTQPMCTRGGYSITRHQSASFHLAPIESNSLREALLSDGGSGGEVRPSHACANAVAAVPSSEYSNVVSLAEEAYVAAKARKGKTPVQTAADVIRGCEMSFCFGIMDSVPEEVIDAMKLVWADSGIQYCYSRSNEYHLMDSCAYFLNQLDRICRPDFVPTDEDILHCRIMTTTISESNFKVHNITISIVDVGGQRSERPKWIPYFDNADAIIYMVAISSYDQVLMEDESTNRITEALNLFASICNNPVFSSTGIIVFLNKIDLFRLKMKTVPVSKYFPKYKGPNTLEDASHFFAASFLELNKNSKRKVYIHFTWATDTKQIKKVLATVYQILTSANLKGAGM